MVGAVFFLLLSWSIDAARSPGSQLTYSEIYLEHKLDESPQIHYQHCDRKYNCLVPSKYFDRLQEKSLYITEETNKQFLDGIEINAISNKEWHMTLMANNSGSAVEFVWATKTLLKCDNDTKAGDIIEYGSNDTTVTAMHDRFLSFSDPTKDGNLSEAMICKFKLEKKNSEDDRTIAVIFAALVHHTQDEKMCLKITGAVNEEYCNYIKDLEPHMRLSFNPPMCKNCSISEDVCDGKDLLACMKAGTYGSGKEALQIRHGTECEYFFSTGMLLVNNQVYAEPLSEVLCHQGRWVMLRYNPMTSWDNPYESREHYIETITSVSAGPHFLCQYSSPLKSLCKQGTDCKKIPVWGDQLDCPEEGYELAYYRKGVAAKKELYRVTCNEQGIWIGEPMENKDSHTFKTYTLRAGDNLVCENSEEAPLEDDDIDLDGGKEMKTELLRRDEAEDFTSAIVLATVVGVLFVILVIIIALVVASCVGPWTGRPAGMKKSEKSQRPIRAVGEEEMSFSDRASLLFT